MWCGLCALVPTDPAFRALTSPPFRLLRRRRDAAGYADRVTLVHDAVTGQLLAYAFMNLETFELPEEVIHWSGEERLTANAASLAGHNIMAAFKRKATGSVPVAHLAALACSPYALKGLGARLITFQRAVALAYGHGSALLALEAMKPLDETYYPKHKFYSTTTAFYKSCTSTVSLTPMFSKVSSADAMPAALQTALAALEKPVEPLISATQRDATRAALWPDGATEHDGLFQGDGTLVGICSFLWHTKDHGRAAEILRQVIVRAALDSTESAKLWAMRHYALAYGKAVTPERAPPPEGLASWCGQPPAVSLDKSERDAILAAWKVSA